MMAKQKNISDLMLEKFALDELSPAQKAEVLERIEQEPEVKARLVAIEKSNAEILKIYPAEQQVPRILDRFRGKTEQVPRRSLRVVWLAAPALAAAAALLIYVAPLGTVDPLVDPGHEIVRIKGDSRLIVHRKIGDEVEMLADGDFAAVGDIIQLSYIAGTAEFGIILSVDGRGEATLHYPGSEGDSTGLDREGTQDLPFAYQLDDAPDFERFFFVTSDKPIDVEQTLAAVEKLGLNPESKPELAPGNHLIDFLLRKN
jgi:hypothetical protein